MARVKFSDLVEGTPNDGDTIPAVDAGGANEKLTLLALLNYVKEGDVALDVLAGNVATSTRKGIIVVSGAPGVPRQLTVDNPGVGRGFCLIVHNDSNADLTVTTGSGTTLVIGTLLSQLVSVTSTGVRNAITGI